MSVPPIEEFPEVVRKRGPATFDLVTLFDRRRQESPGGHIQDEHGTGDRFHVVMSLRALRPGLYQRLLSWETRLWRGRIVGQVPLFPYKRQGGSAGLGTVDGSDQDTRELKTKGWASSSLVFADGDFFTITDTHELCHVDGDVESDSDGAATIKLHRPLRRPPPDEAGLEIELPYLLVLADNDTDLGYQFTPPRRAALTRTYLEHIHWEADDD